MSLLIEARSWRSLILACPENQTYTSVLRRVSYPSGGCLRKPFLNESLQKNLMCKWKKKTLITWCSNTHYVANVCCSSALRLASWFIAANCTHTDTGNCVVHCTINSTNCCNYRNNTIIKFWWFLGCFLGRRLTTSTGHLLNWAWCLLVSHHVIMKHCTEVCSKCRVSCRDLLVFTSVFCSPLGEGICTWHVHYVVMLDWLCSFFAPIAAGLMVSPSGRFAPLVCVCVCVCVCVWAGVSG